MEAGQIIIILLLLLLGFASFCLIRCLPRRVQSSVSRGKSSRKAWFHAGVQCFSQHLRSPDIRAKYALLIAHSPRPFLKAHPTLYAWLLLSWKPPTVLLTNIQELGATPLAYSYFSSRSPNRLNLSEAFYPPKVRPEMGIYYQLLVMVSCFHEAAHYIRFATHGSQSQTPPFLGQAWQVDEANTAGEAGWWMEEQLFGGLISACYLDQKLCCLCWESLGDRVQKTMTDPYIISMLESGPRPPRPEELVEKPPGAICLKKGQGQQSLVSSPVSPTVFPRGPCRKAQM